MKTSILIIEDNQQNLYLATYLLEKHDYRVLQATNGREGLSVAEREKPELILLDIQLPEMDGYTVARELLRSTVVPIVAITSHAMAGDKKKALDAGCTGYIEKPINPDTFIQQIAECLQG